VTESCIGRRLRDCTRWLLTFLLLFNVVCGECLYLNKRDTKKHKKRLLCDLVHGNGYLRRTAMPSLANTMARTSGYLRQAHEASARLLQIH